MHYIGMLAFIMPMKVLYDVRTVVVSLFTAIAASGVALVAVSGKRMSVVQALVGSVFMGCGIAAMHYVGMAAMRAPMRIDYNPYIVSVSVLLAIGISLLALFIAFRMRDGMKPLWQKIGSAISIGIAIPVMHYTGMWAATFRASPPPSDIASSVEISYIGITAIAGSTLFILALVIAASFLDRLLSAQKAVTESARAGERYFRTLANAIPQIIWTALPNGEIDFYNERWYAYTGSASDKPLPLEKAVHVADLRSYSAGWRDALEIGAAYELECRFLQMNQSTYLWHLVRSVPLRDRDAVIKWLGTCTDIHNQKSNQLA